MMANEIEVLSAIAGAITELESGYDMGRFVRRANVQLRGVRSNYRFKMTSDEYQYLVFVEDKDHPDIVYADALRDNAHDEAGEDGES